MSEDFPPEIITCKLKPQEGASGGKSTALSMYWVHRCYSLGTYYSVSLPYVTDNMQKSRKGRVTALG